MILRNLKWAVHGGVWCVGTYGRPSVQRLGLVVGSDKADMDIGAFKWGYAHPHTPK